MSVTEPLITLSAQEWDSLVVPDEQADIELVQGVPVVSPGESFANRMVCDRVLIELHRLCRPRLLWPVSELHLTLSVGPRPTIRRPDVMVLRAGAPVSATRMEPHFVALVVEVVSPASRERGWVTTPREYARAGIPALLIIEPDPERPAMALLTSPGPDGYAARASGTEVTWSSPAGGVELRLAGLLP